jgi:RHS repeat-associated protein
MTLNIRTSIAVLLLLIAKLGYAQGPGNLSGQNVNYRSTNQILVKNKKLESDMAGLQVGETIQQVQYLDDSGRPIEIVTTKGSPLQNDVIVHKSFDQLGREPITYLPFVSGNTGAFQSGLGATSRTVNFDDSPMSRVTSFANTIGGGATTSYIVNASAEVKNWVITDNGNMNYVLNFSYYDAGQLRGIMQVENQTGSTQISYTDKEGRTILSKVLQSGSQWAETYYIYDILGDLRFVLTPEGGSLADQINPPGFTLIKTNTTLTAPNTANYLYMPGATVTLAASSSGSFQPPFSVSPYAHQMSDNFSTTYLNQQAYQFVYDSRHRKIAERKPGTDWKYFVYDSRDRLVLTQDGNQRIASQWTFIKYDYLNRPILSGLVTLTDTFSSLQSTYDNITVFNEDRGTLVHGYTNNTIPSVPDPNAYLSATYYDDYSFKSLIGGTNYNYSSSEIAGLPSTEFTRVRGLVTGSKVNLIGTTNWVWTVNYYDDRLRSIQIVGDNHIGGIDRSSTLYNFAGWTMAVRTTHNSVINGVSTAATTLRENVYDHMGRLTQTNHQIGNQPKVIESSKHYNDFNQVSEVDLHSMDQIVSSATFLDYATFSYHATEKNLMLSRAHKRSDGFNFFTQNMAYESQSFDASANSPTWSNARVDGLPGGTQWYPDNAAKNRYYFFSYDKNDQLLSSNYKQIESAITKSDLISENNLSYDLNGNIKTLARFGGTTTAQTIDYLTYSPGNQLMYVSDASANPQGLNDQNTSGNDYTYDPNGNLTADKNKGITSITYNIMNRPLQVTFSNNYYTKYTYDAAGTKLNQTYFDNLNNPITKTDYVGEFIYINGVLQLVHTSRGRIVPSSNQNMIAVPDCSSATDFATATGCTLTNQVVGSQNYVRAVGVSGVGITSIGGTFNVRPGETYKFRVLGYRTSADVRLVILANGGTLTTYGPSLNLGASAEGWVEMIYTVPTGVNSIVAAVQWNGTETNDTFYLNHVSLYKTDWEYQYFIKDNVGSTRAVLQTNPKSITYLATMEPSNIANENSSANFNGSINTSFIQNASPANSTPGVVSVAQGGTGGSSVFLNSSYRIGPNKSLRVLTGDKIDLKATTFYPAATSSLSSVAASTMITAVAAAMSGGTQVVIDGITSAYTSTGSNFALSPTSSTGTTVPSAYLNYILYDDNYVPVKAKSIPIGGVANTKNYIGTDANGIQVNEPGYLFVYLSYDDANTSQLVYFDDLRIILTEGHMIQSNTYYPFGMIASSWTRSGEQDNRYYYQGKELDPNAGWHDFGSRMYYADLGRWFATDPQNQFASPYMAMGNAPMMGQDPNGEYFLVDDVVACVVGAVANVIGNWDHITAGKNFWDDLGRGLQYGAAGAAGGEVSLYAGPEAGFATAGALNMGVDYEYGYLNKNSSFGDWAKSFVNGGMSSLGAGEAGLDAAKAASERSFEKGGERLFTKEAFEDAENASKGLLEKWGPTKSLFDTHFGEFKFGDYLHDGLKAGRDAVLNAYKDSDGKFDAGDVARNFGLGFASNFTGRAITSSMRQGVWKKLSTKYYETLSFQIGRNATEGKDVNMSDFLNDGLSTLISVFGGRLGPIRYDPFRGVSEDFPGGEMYYLNGN